MATTDTNIFAFSPMPIKLSFRQKNSLWLWNVGDNEACFLISKAIYSNISNAFKRTLYFKSAFFKKVLDLKQ